MCYVLSFFKFYDHFLLSDFFSLSPLKKSKFSNFKKIFVWVLASCNALIIFVRLWGQTIHPNELYRLITDNELTATNTSLSLSLKAEAFPISD